VDVQRGNNEGPAEGAGKIVISKKIHTRAAQEFLDALDPDAGEFTFQTFSDSNALKVMRQGRLVDPYARTIKATFAKAVKELAEKNKFGVGVFVTVNATNGVRRTRGNFDRPRAVFADLDGVPMPKWPLAPSIIVESSKGKFHCYWLIDGDMSLDVWSGCMRRIVDRYGADKNATDPTRVLRLPGFFHCKGKPSMVKLVEYNGRRYTAGSLVKAFPPIKGREKRSPKRARSSNEVDIGALCSALEHLAATPHPRLRHGGTYVDDYETWMLFGLAIKRDLGDDGFAIWDEWSRFSDRYPGTQGSRAKWDNDLDVDAAAVGGEVHVATIFHRAKLQGWSRTKYEVRAALEAAQAARAQRVHVGGTR
jgi:hypothetical protein